MTAECDLESHHLMTNTCSPMLPAGACPLRLPVLAWHKSIARSRPHSESVSVLKRPRPHLKELPALRHSGISPVLNTSPGLAMYGCRVGCA